MRRSISGFAAVAAQAEQSPGLGHCLIVLRRSAAEGEPCQPEGEYPVKLVLLAAAAVLAASPAIADCQSDAQVQAEKVRTAQQLLGNQASAPMAEQCRTGSTLIAEAKRLNAINRNCQAQLQLTAQDLQRADQRIQAADQEYATQCGG